MDSSKAWSEGHSRKQNVFPDAGAKSVWQTFLSAFGRCVSLGTLVQTRMSASLSPTFCARVFPPIQERPPIGFLKI